jgi:hypothetical protein
VRDGDQSLPARSCVIRSMRGALCASAVVVAALLASLRPGTSYAFAEDVCPASGGGWAQCSLQACTPGSEALPCETIAMLTTAVAQFARRGTGGARSTVHFDATYYLAQAVGFSPRDAYFVAAYDQATDTGSYVHRGEDGVLAGEATLDTQTIGGMDRNNFSGGGVFFHFMAPREGVTTADGLAPHLDAVDEEPLLHHVRRWAYGQGPLCVGGLTQIGASGDVASGASCYVSSTRPESEALGRIPFVTELGFLGYADWISPLGEQGVVTDPASGEIAPASAAGAYVGPEIEPLLRLGVYVHALQDRISHHRCNLASQLEGPRAADAGSILTNPLIGPGYEFLQSLDPAELLAIFTEPQLFEDPDFFFEFDTAECDQLAHANRHTWETGVEQDSLSPENQTTRAALLATVDELERYAQFHLFAPAVAASSAQKQEWADAMVAALEIVEPGARVAAFSALAQDRVWLPLPLHAGLSYADWDASAGIYAFKEGAAAPETGEPGEGSSSGALGLAYGLLGLLAAAARGLRRALPLALLAAGGTAQALDFELGPITVNGGFTASTGASWRLESPATQFIGKTNVEGQQLLCAADDCLSFSGDPAPNQRLVDAAGGYLILNGDDGNLNYDKGDITYATTRFIPRLTLTWGDWLLKASVLAYYDPVNQDFDEQHPNTRFQPASTPRPDGYVEDFALGYKTRELFLSGTVQLGEHQLAINVGNQIIRWGEANTLLFSTLNQINPIDATIARMPGFQLSEIPIPSSAVVVSGDLMDNVSAELIWLYGWRPVVVDPPGSFMSTNDIAGGGDHAVLTLGQFSEDPNGEFSLAFPASIASSTSVTVPVLDSAYGYPDSGDEFGLKLGYFADWLLDGTEFGLYYLHYHSRLPYFSSYASDASCARDSPDIVQATLTCQGFTGIFDPLVPGEGLEPIPIETSKFFLEYPKDLDMLGASFNTTLGSWAVTGELAYHPRLPLQVQIVDVAFATLQPTLPRQDLHLGLGTLTDIAAQLPAGSELAPLVAGLIEQVTAGAVPDLTIPGYRSAFPDFLSVYRGVDIQPNQYIAGYEKLDVAQFTINGLQVFRRNPIGAEQIIVLIEAGITHVFGMPGTDRLQFEGGGDETHASPGADGTGNNGETDARRFNPTQMTSGFATETSAGYRVLVQPSYSNVFGLFNLRPTLLWQHDVYGISPFPMQNFIEGRKNLVALIDFEFSQNIKAQLMYQAYFGADQLNLLVDRDSAGLAVIFDF